MMHFPLPMYAIVRESGTEPSIKTFPVVHYNNIIYTAGDRTLKWGHLFEMNSKTRKVYIQLHPTSHTRPGLPSRSIVPISWLWKYGAVFHTIVQPKTKAVISLPIQALLRLPQRSDLSFPTQRLTKMSAQIFPADFSFDLQTRSIDDAITDMIGNDSTEADVSPAKRNKLSARIKQLPMYSCSVCETETRCTFDFNAVDSDAIPDIHSLHLLRDDKDEEEEEDKSKAPEFICTKCIIENFKATKKILTCLECTNLGELLPFEYAFRIFASHPDIDEWLADSVQEVLEYLPDENDAIDAIENFMDEFVNEDSVLYELCDAYLLTYSNTRFACACHPTHPAIGVLDEETGLLDFSTCCTLYPVQCLTIQPDRSVTQQLEYQEHPPVCMHCLESHPSIVECNITENYLNPYFRAEDNDKKRLYRNKEISMKMIKQYLTKIVFDNHLHITCPGCSKIYHRTEQCYELTCNCGFRLCGFCNFAQFQSFPLIDHFTTNRNAIECGHYCPRYESNIGPLAGEEYKCTSKCQSHTVGDCCLPSHQVYRKRLLRLRRNAMIKKFVRALDTDKYAEAMSFLIAELNYDLHASLDIIH